MKTKFSTITLKHLILAVTTLTSSAAHADNCDDAAAQVASAVPGLTFIGRHEARVEYLGPEVHFRHPYGGTIEIFCPPPGPAIVTIDSPTAYPSREFLQFVERVAVAETGARAASVRAALIKSCDAARRNDDNTKVIPGAEISCNLLPNPKITEFEIKKR